MRIEAYKSNLMTKQITWSTEQQDIIKWFKNGRGNAVVKSYAGVGKTSVIIEGLNHAPETNILYSTFNKKNQIEASEKIQNRNVKVMTLHSLGFSYLKGFWGHKLRATNWAETNRIKKACPEFPQEFCFIIQKLVSYLKNGYLNPTLENAKDIQDIRGLELFGDNKKWNEKIPEIAMDVLKLSENYTGEISFDDMVYLPSKLNLVKPSFQMAVVDESQDQSLSQLTMIINSVLPNGRICMVGDDLQNLYVWRGAMLNSLKIFKEKLNAIEFPLSITYRCPRKVVTLAQSIVPDYKYADFAPEGEVIHMDYDNAIKSLKVNDALLSRTNFPLVPACLKLIRQNIPAYIQGREITKQLIGIINDLEENNIYDFLNALQNWYDVKLNLLNGKRNAAQKIDLLKEQAETLKYIANECLKQNKNQVQDVIDTINSIFFDSDYVKKPSVVCSTVHRAKGAEWNQVFMLNDTFNVSHPKMTQEDLQCEKHIYYVSVTRARQKLVVVNGLGDRLQQQP